MSEITNNNVIANGVKFVDFAGLDHFWSIAKAYINAEDAKLQGAIDAVAGVVGDDNSGLVKDVKTLQTEVAALGGAEGGIQGMIDKSLEPYSTTEEMNSAIATATTDMATNASVDGKLESYSTTTEVEGMISGAKTELQGAIDGVEEKVDNHIADAVAHITADERTSWNAAVSKIDTFLKDAELDAEGKNVIDTLKELQSYIESDGSAAEELISRVAANEAILEGFGTEAGEIANVKTAIATAKSEAITDAKTYVDGAEYKGQFDAAGSAEAVKTYVDGAEYKANFDAAGSAEAVKTYVDGDEYKANFDAAGAAATAAGEVKTYVDGDAYKAQFDAAGSAEAVKTYVDGDEYKANFDAAGSAEAVKTYVDGAEYKANFDAAGSAATAESNANAYTDALANSIVVASLSDIDSIFGVTDHNHDVVEG